MSHGLANSRRIEMAPQLAGEGAAYCNPNAYRNANGHVSS